MKKWSEVKKSENKKKIKEETKIWKKGINIPEGYYFVIDANRWFQPTYGNTYHSVYIYLAGGEGSNYKKELIAYETFTYGYGDAYMQTAAVLLNVNHRTLRDDYREYGEDKYVINVTDVKRKKDL